MNEENKFTDILLENHLMNEGSILLQQKQINPLSDAKNNRESYLPAHKLSYDNDLSKEVIDRRGEFSKTIKTGHDTYRIISDKSPLHFNSDGRMKEINLLIRDLDGKKVMTDASYKVEIFTDRIGYRLLQANDSQFSIELVKINNLPVNNTSITSKVDGCQIFYEGLFSNVHTKILLRPDKPEIFTMLDDESAPKSFTWLVKQNSLFSFKSRGADAKGDSLELLVSQSEVVDNNFLYTENWTGRVSRVKDKKNRIKGLFNDPVYPVVIDPSVTISVTANADDGATSSGGIAWQSANMLYVGFGSHKNYPGMRFLNVGVPAGATITSAHLKPKVKNVFSNNGNGKIVGNKVASAAAWSTPDRPAVMAKTTAKAAWSPSVGVNSVPITNVVGEIVAQGGWASGNNMKFGWMSMGASGANINIYDHNTSPANSAQLVIDYTVPSAGSSGSLLLMGIGN